ncbi:MAG: DUF21 domain-containing protein, partial [Muribaculaceae bacterium]|nr:DUF21 domain-containing protein [Muribaculaceae bacterium]
MTPDQQLWLIISIVSLIFSAIFSGVEIAFVTSDRVRLEIDVQKGGALSRILNLFYAHSDFFISTILVGNNIMLVVYGMGMAKLIEPLLQQHINSDVLVLLSQTLISTGIILLAGEFLPKTMFRINPNLSLRYFALPIFLIYLILYPVSLLATGISKG